MRAGRVGRAFASCYCSVCYSGNNFPFLDGDAEEQRMMLLIVFQKLQALLGTETCLLAVERVYGETNLCPERFKG